MKFSWVNALLWVVIVAGAICLWRSNSEHMRLQEDADRLEALTGDLVPADPTQIYVRAIKTEDPLDFAWRVYFPPGYPLQVRRGTVPAPQAGTQTLSMESPEYVYGRSMG